jgi:predicted nucleic acid-binding protein
MTGALLVDTSVWVEHLRRTDARLQSVLEDPGVEVVTHEMVVGELALSGMKRTDEQFSLILEYRHLPTVDEGELLAFIESGGLVGTGIGYVDANLAASCLIAGAKLLTLDKRLASVARNLGIRFGCS